MDLDIQRLGVEREWADLPDELLREISSNLFAKDVQSFSLVCGSRNKAVDASFYRLLPCLMMYHRRKHMWKFYQHDRFFYMTIPELDSAHICSSNYGWLLMSREDGTMFFFDPFNRHRMELPGARDDDYITIHFFNKPISDECFLIGIKNHEIESEMSVKIGILKRGKDRWESYICRSKDPFRVTLAAPVLRNGLLYFVDVKGNVATLDVDRIESSWTVHTKCLPFYRLRNKIRQHFLFEMVDRMVEFSEDENESESESEEEEEEVEVEEEDKEAINAVEKYEKEDKEDEKALNEVEKDEEEDRYKKALYAVFMMHDNENVNLFRFSEENMKWELVEFMCARTLYLSQGSSFGHFYRFCSLVDSILLPRFKLETDEMIPYSMHAQKYYSYSLDDDFENSWYSSSYGIRKLDVGVTWILPASSTDYDVPTW